VSELKTHRTHDAMTEPKHTSPSKEELAKYFAIYDRVGSKLSGLRDNMELKEGTRVDRALKTEIAAAMILENKKPADAEDVIRNGWSHLIQEWERTSEDVEAQKGGCLGLLVAAFVAATVLGSVGMWLVG
jgi:hypothetical protein